jgi:hypothetical protein
MRGPLGRLVLRVVHGGAQPSSTSRTISRPQPLCEVLAKNEVSTCSTFLLLHFGQLGALAPCSDSGSTRSKTFLQSRQRYSYVGTHSSIPGSSQEGAACNPPGRQALNQRRAMDAQCPSGPLPNRRMQLSALQFEGTLDGVNRVVTAADARSVSPRE